MVTIFTGLNTIQILKQYVSIDLEPRRGVWQHMEEFTELMRSMPGTRSSSLEATFGGYSSDLSENFECCRQTSGEPQHFQQSDPSDFPSNIPA